VVVAVRNTYSGEIWYSGSSMFFQNVNVLTDYEYMVLNPKCNVLNLLTLRKDIFSDKNLILNISAL
jgi:hypothetical protein